MDGQMSIYDFIPDQDPPQKWECMKTCARADIMADHFPQPNGGKRCLYGITQDGTSGKDVYEKIKDNMVTFYCKYYKMK